MTASASMPVRPLGAARRGDGRRGRLVGRVSGVLATVTVVLATIVGPGASPASAATRCGSTVPAGQVRVVVVVDPGAGGSPGSTCLVVAEGTTGAQLLAQRAGLLGTTTPRYAESGLLCAIDGFPGEGCGDRTSGGYLYWSYWSGTSGSWVYGQGNPFVRRIRDGDIEGWRFVDGSGSGADPTPRVGPSASLFPALAPPPAPPAPVHEPAPGTGGGAGGAPAAGGAGSGPPPAAGAPSTGDPTTTGAVPATDDPSVTSTTPAATATTDDSGADADVEELAVMPTSSDSGSDGAGGAAAGVVLVLVLTAGIGAAAVVQARPRRSEGA
jgi:hypothetical protein